MSSTVPCIFSEKHFAGGQAVAMRWMIRLGIQLRAITAFVHGDPRHALSVVDAFSVGLIDGAWCARDVEWLDPMGLSAGRVVGIGGVMVGGVWLAWGSAFVRVRTLVGSVAGAVLFLLLCTLLPESMRVSRLSVGITAVWMVCVPWMVRLALVSIRPARFRWRSSGRVGLMSRQEREVAMQNWVQGAFGSVLDMKTLAMKQSDWREGV